MVLEIRTLPRCDRAVVVGRLFFILLDNRCQLLEEAAIYNHAGLLS
jgi:hypothetical protein